MLLTGTGCCVKGQLDSNADLLEAFVTGNAPITWDFLTAVVSGGSQMAGGASRAWSWLHRPLLKYTRCNSG